MKALNVIAIFTAFLMAIMMITPTFAANAPQAQNFTWTFYNATTLFSALVSGQISIMGWPLTTTQLATAETTSGIAIAPYGEAGTYGVAINCNLTDDAHAPGVNGHPAGFVKAEADVHFRDAIACLVNKDDAIATQMGGQATRIDTEVYRPLDNAHVNYQVSQYAADGSLLGNDPTSYNVQKALTILWTYGFYPTYGSLAALLTAYGSSGPLPMGSVKYPSTLTTGETITGYTTDGAGFTAPIGSPVTTPEAASVVGTAIDTLVVYIRTDPNRKYIGDALVAKLTSLGIATTQPLGYVTGSQIQTPVMMDRSYDIYTNGWSLGGAPTQFYGLFGSWNIYPYGQSGPNFYQFNDPLMDYWAMYDYPLAANASIFNDAVQQCQFIQVNQTASDPVYTLSSYMAYNSKAVGAIDYQGYGLEQYFDYTSLNMKVPNGAGQYAPNMNIVYGTYDIPDMVNPLFQSWVWDQEVSDRMFNSGLEGNPYAPTSLDKTVGVEPWQVYDYNFQLSDFNTGGGYQTLPPAINGTAGAINTYYGTNTGHYTQCANITYYLRHDISWSDGVPLTALDINYTDFINAAYGNSWDYSDMSQIVNFVIYDNYTFSVYLDMPSYLSYGLGVEVDFLPMHLYANIVCPDSDALNTNTNPWIATPLTISGSCTTGLQGYWPGAAAIQSDFVSTFPSYGVTYNHVAYGGTGGNNTGPALMWTGSGMWEYKTGFDVSNPTGFVLQPNPYFFLNITSGDINFQYTWDSSTLPSGGSYNINLPDLTYLANAYGTKGAVILPATSNYVPVTPPGSRGVWNPACDIAVPSGIVGLTDLATMALNYGKHWGGYGQWTFVATGSVPSPALTVYQYNQLYTTTYSAGQLSLLGPVWCSENPSNLPVYKWAGTPVSVTVNTSTHTITAAY